MSRCRWPGCDRDIPHGHYACKGHWWLIPLRLRVRLNAAWRAYRPDRTVDTAAAYRGADTEVREWARGQP